MSDELVLRGGGLLLMLMAFSVLLLEGILMFLLKFSASTMFVMNGALYTAIIVAVLAQRAK